MSFVPNSKFVCDVTKNHHLKGLTNVGDDPDSIHKVHLVARGCSHRVPCHKTDEEIDRLYEYNKMMGRAT